MSLQVKGNKTFYLPLDTHITMDWIKGRPHRDVLQELQEKRNKDYTYSSSRILGSMCTQPHPIAQKAYNMFLETNMGDPELFPGAKELEEKVIGMVAQLLHAPPTYGGKFLSGGTEGNLTALHIALSLTKKREVIVPETAHFSFLKAASLLNFKLKIVPTKDHRMDVTKFSRMLDKKTGCVVAVAGTTGLGLVDPIPDIADICRQEHVFLHIDAAFGGFVIPFLQQLGDPVPSFDFSLPGVHSISLDPHKMGQSIIPSGILILRQKKWGETISVPSPCISTTKQASILGTRPGGAVAATYAVMSHLGQEGYRALVERCMGITRYTVNELRKQGFIPLIEPQMNVIGIKVKHPPQIIKKLTGKGWKISFDPQLHGLRLVIMPHVKKRLIKTFISDLKKVV